MNELVATITQIGKQKSFSANLQGIKIQITHLAVGTGSYTPNENMLALQNEIERVVILSSEINTAEQTITVYAVLQSQAEYWINEIGLFLDDGTLFAIWSHPTLKLGYKSQMNKFLLGFRLKLVNVPISSVQIIDEGADLRLFFSEEFVRLGNALTLIGDSVLAVQDRLAAVQDRLADEGADLRLFFSEEFVRLGNALTLIGDSVLAVQDRLANEHNDLTKIDTTNNIRHYNVLEALIANTAALTSIGDALVVHKIYH